MSLLMFCMNSRGLTSRRHLTSQNTGVQLSFYCSKLIFCIFWWKRINDSCRMFANN